MKFLMPILLTLFITSCGSAEVKKSTKVCKIIKHEKDNLYQIKIDNKAVNNRWYMQADAREIKMILGIKNKCKR